MVKTVIVKMLQKTTAHLKKNFCCKRNSELCHCGPVERLVGYSDDKNNLSLKCALLKA